MDQALMECVAEDEAVASPFGVAEMWQRLPLLLVKETLATSLFRMPVNCAGLIPHGSLCCRTWPSSTKVSCSFGILKEKLVTRMKHAVLPSPHTFVNFRQDINEMHFYYRGILELLGSLCEAVSYKRQPVATVTFFKGVCHRLLESTPPGPPSLSGISWFFEELTTLQSVHFVRCTVKAEINCRISRAKEKANQCSGWVWSYWMELPVKVLTREEMKQWDDDFREELRRRTEYLDRGDFEGAEDEYRGRYETIAYQLGRSWLLEWLLESKSLVSALLWPYPVEQLHWLKASLDNLSISKRARVAYAYESYRSRREYQIYQPGRKGLPEEKWEEGIGNWHSVMRSGYREEWQVEVDIRWGKSDRKLDIIDCAFMAQRLSTMPGVPKPPYNVPFDFKYWRKHPTPDEWAEWLAEIERDIALFKLRTSS